MRIWLLWLIIVFLCFYSFKDWFKVSLVLIVLMPLYGHPEFPSGALGIQGLNPWNLLLLFVLFGYFTQKKKDDSKWDLDKGTTTLVVFYVVVICVSAIRATFDIESLRYYGSFLSKGDIISENLINPIKFLFPAFFVYVGANTVERRRLTLWAIFLSNLYIALVVVKSIPISAVTDVDALTHIGLKVLQNTFSWSKVNTATLLSGAAWAFLFSVPYLVKGKIPFPNVVASAMFMFTTLALALTGGRMGYAVWLILAIVFSFMRWKKGLVLIPILLVTIVSTIPSVSERLLTGISLDEKNIDVQNQYAVTSGRTDAWPVVINKIYKQPMFGYGALSMTRTGAEMEVAQIQNLNEGDRGFPHPHNAYLWLLFDTGIIGAIPILLFWFVVVKRTLKLCGNRGTEGDTIGITNLALVSSFLIAALGSQNFYPVHGAITMWASIALTLRMHKSISTQRQAMI